MKQRNSVIPASYLILEKENKVLLIRRFNTGYADGKYTLPSGHVDENESVTNSIIRETEEEVGVIVKKENLEFVKVLYRKKDENSNKNEQRVDFFFKTNSWIGKPTNMEPHKCDDVQWFSIDNIPNNCLDYVKEVILNKNKKFREVGY
ncbi:NUDIX domain-containing protein [archaeon]|jgi:8-oxo-dGTP diphosphatase|nr:NUDIX domain-containing protein [archaeon]MBT4647153.1 NUDIX domain-containing protein [archaeon]MBT6822156.1 NUDIX domain-containing protein [archaeon]MBT7391769.1 NUDIX domain-containing protein [archaeon]